MVVSKNGADYFKYNRDSYIVVIPVRMVSLANGRDAGLTKVSVTEAMKDNFGEGALVLPELKVLSRMASEAEERDHLRRGIDRNISSLDTYNFRGTNMPVVAN